MRGGKSLSAWHLSHCSLNPLVRPLLRPGSLPHVACVSGFVGKSEWIKQTGQGTPSTDKLFHMCPCLVYTRDGHTRHKRLWQKGSCVHRCLTKACELIDNTSWLCSCRRGLSPELAVRSFASVCSSVGKNCSDLHLPYSGETSELIACFTAVVKSEKLKSPFTA